MSSIRFYFFLIVLLFSAQAKINAQIGFGPEVGIGMSSMHFAPPLEPIHYTAASVNAVFSGKIGAMADIPFNKHIYFQTGLYVSHKGVTRDFSYYKNDSFNEAVHQQLNLNYFDLPANIVFKSGMQGKGRFILGIGVTASYLFTGKNKLHDHQVYNDTLTVTDDNYTINSKNTFTGFDIGINLFAGYELATGLFFKAYYTAGYKDISLSSEIDKNRMWGISAGYIFGKGRNINKEADKEGLIDKSTD